jgi:pyruvate dehydrogenase E1 component beta subunit
MPELRMTQAIQRALAEALTEDPEVILLGEDIGAAGGPFGATRGLQEKFGPERVRDTPISEAGIVGAAVGAALSGLKPVAEIMFMDFITLAMDALVNQAAKARFMFGGEQGAPLVLRTPHGGGVSAGPQHSQCLEAWLCHVPGLKVVCPATPVDAYGLLKSAIADPDPVVVIENKALYALKGEVGETPEAVPIGHARHVRPGRDATILAYGAAVGWALTAADLLADQGVEAELLDLRSLQPWDEQAVLESLSRTHHLVIAHEAVEAFGVAARIAEIGFDDLDGPILRVAAPFLPVPFARELEAAYRPDAARIAEAVRRTLA